MWEPDRHKARPRPVLIQGLELGLPCQQAGARSWSAQDRRPAHRARRLARAIAGGDRPPVDPAAFGPVAASADPPIGVDGAHASRRALSYRMPPAEQLQHRPYDCSTSSGVCEHHVDRHGALAFIVTSAPGVTAIALEAPRWTVLTHEQ